MTIKQEPIRMEVKGLMIDPSSNNPIVILRDPESQAFTFDLALSVLESAPAPRTTVQSPLRWDDNADWKLDYCNIDRLTPEEIALRRSEFDRGKAEARRLRDETGVSRAHVDDEIA